MQYPIVFCPFLWDARSRADSGPGLRYFDAESGRTVLDMRSEAGEAAKALRDKERLGERVRLTYVALTRAQDRCYIAFGPATGVSNSGLAWILGISSNDWERFVTPLFQLERDHPGAFVSRDLQAVVSNARSWESDSAPTGRDERGAVRAAPGGSRFADPATEPPIELGLSLIHI